ncbi:MAG: ABC transporter ATP-binding protein [Bacteroidales bacterium]|nr:ABC transporter ATP-binding protein [Bacteroidales bacterium]
MNNELNQRETALEIRNLVRYYGDLLAVDNLTLQVRKGEVFGFLGPNGAGKTTSIRMMCGLLRPTSGEVLINGERISNAGIRSHHLRVGICPQEIILWNKLTCYEQLVFMGRMYDVPGKTARDRADLLLDRIGLREKRNKLVSTLSGGMKRRLNVIMAIVHEPEIVVFDEPEAGLDPQSRIMVRDFIQQTSEEKTVIFTTHNMDEAERISDRVAIIDRGKLLQLDTPEHLKKSIGKGDVLELRIQVTNDKSYDIVADKLRENKFDLMISEERWIIKAMDLVPKIHMIYKILDQEGIQVRSMNMRENTLEDVFIHLTGRRLRQ